MDEDRHDELLRVHDQLRRVTRRFIAAITVAFAGVASTVAKRIADHDDEETYGLVVVLSLAGTLLGALEAREARTLQTRMFALLRR